MGRTNSTFRQRKISEIEGPWVFRWSEPIHIFHSSFQISEFFLVSVLNFYTRSLNSALLAHMINYNSPGTISHKRVSVPLNMPWAKNVKCRAYHFSKWHSAISSRRPTHGVLVFFINIIITYFRIPSDQQTFTPIGLPLSMTTDDIHHSSVLSLYTTNR